jgi:hypothetical protein
MKAITIKQPWASLIIEGGKDIENRTRRTHVRGWVLVHAGQSWSDELCFSVFDFCRAKGLLEYREINPDGSASERVRSVIQSVPILGGIIGAMHISDCVESSDSPWFMGPDRKGQFAVAHRCFGYVIDRVVKLPFLPCRGHQGWFNVELPPEMEALIPKV